MAVENLTLLQIVQEVFTAIRETKPTSLSSQTTRTQEVVQAVKDVYLEVCSMNNGHLKFLESSGTITLATDDRDYAMAADVKDLCLESFILDNQDDVEYLDYNSFMAKYPDITDTGKPYNITVWNNEFLIGYVPSSSYDGKTIPYKYWKQPDDIVNDGDYPLIPKELRRRVLVFGAAAQLFQTDSDPSYKLYWDRYMGAIADLKRGYSSATPGNVRVTHVF